MFNLISSSEGSLLAFMASTHFSRSSRSPLRCKMMPYDAIFWIWCKTDAKQWAKRSKLRVSRKCSESINCCVHVEVAVEVQCLWLINWGTEELQPTHVGSSCESCDLRMNCMPLCRYVAMPLCHWLLTPLPSISTPRFPPSLMTLSTTWDRDQNQPDASRYVKHHGAMRINLWSIMQHQTEAPSSTCLSLPSLLLRV